MTDWGGKLQQLQDSRELMMRSQQRWGHYDQTHAERTKWTHSGGWQNNRGTPTICEYQAANKEDDHPLLPSEQFQYSLWSFHAVSWTACGRILEHLSRGRVSDEGKQILVIKFQWCFWLRQCCCSKHVSHNKKCPRISESFIFRGKEQIKMFYECPAVCAVWPPTGNQAF